MAGRGDRGAEGLAEGDVGAGYEVLPSRFADGVPQVAVTAPPASEELRDREGVVVFVSSNREGVQPGVAEGLAKVVGLAEPLFPWHGLDRRSGVDAEVGSDLVHDPLRRGALVVRRRRDGSRPGAAREPAAGAQHPDEVGQNVSAIMNSKIGVLATVTDDDIQGGRSLYGPPGVPENNNFAAATVINFNGGQLALKGYNTNATKEAGEPNHAGNSGGHSIWWRSVPSPTSFRWWRKIASWSRTVCASCAVAKRRGSKRSKR